MKLGALSFIHVSHIIVRDCKLLEHLQLLVAEHMVLFQKGSVQDLKTAVLFAMTK